MQRPYLALATAAVTVCGDGAATTQVQTVPQPSAVTQSTPAQNSILFPKTSHPYGASRETWAERESQWIYGHPYARNPLIDQTGADCAEGQTDEHVCFLPRIAGPRVFSRSRRCVVPRGKAIFVEIGAYVNPWPCPDPSFAQLDACVTGSPQPAVVDGFFMMFKPLDPGEHTIRVYGTDVRGADTTYVYYPTVL